MGRIALGRSRPGIGSRLSFADDGIGEAADSLDSDRHDVTILDGWDSGPPYQARIRIATMPERVLTTTKYYIGEKKTFISTVEFDVHAMASCAVGIDP